MEFVCLKDQTRKFTIDLPFRGNCKSVDNFEKVCRVGEGTYGIVYKAKNKETGEIIALKRVRMEKEAEGLPISSLREISLLKSCKHENIVQVFDVVVGFELDNLFLVMEYCEFDLAYIMDEIIGRDKIVPFNLSESNLMLIQVKCLMHQLLSGVDYLHNRWIVHRDLKMSNLLLNSSGTLKIADFGLARKENLLQMTPKVATLWYRSPELLFGLEKYDRAIDMWALGCIFAEFLISKPLLPGKDELSQVQLICDLLGAPSEASWPGFNQLPLSHLVSNQSSTYSTLKRRIGRVSKHSFDFIQQLLKYDPVTRISSTNSLKHEYFTEKPESCNRKELWRF